MGAGDVREDWIHGRKLPRVSWSRRCRGTQIRGPAITLVGWCWGSARVWQQFPPFIPRTNQDSVSPFSSHGSGRNVIHVSLDDAADDNDVDGECNDNSSTIILGYESPTYHCISDNHRSRWQWWVQKRCYSLICDIPLTGGSRHRDWVSDLSWNPRRQNPNTWEEVCWWCGSDWSDDSATDWGLAKLRAGPKWVLRIPADFQVMPLCRRLMIRKCEVWRCFKPSSVHGASNWRRTMMVSCSM